MAGISNGQTASADEVMNAIGANFVDNSQLLFNADYIGFSSKLHNTGVPNTDNVLYSTFTSDDADINLGFLYDSTNDLYTLTDMSGISEYVIVEATSYDGDWVNGTNNVEVFEITTGAWVVYCTTGTAAVRRAQIHKSLWWGNGSGATQTVTPLILDFTSVTAVKTDDSTDVGKQAHTVKGSVGAAQSAVGNGVFADTSTNTNCNSWSYMITGTGGDEAWEVPTATLLNASGDELGTDTSADDKSNPANCKINIVEGGGTSSGIAIILCKGDIGWTHTGTNPTTDIDFFTDNSIPLLTQAGSLAAEGVGTATLIFKDTAGASVTNAIPSINSTVDAANSEQISISANSGSNYTNVNNGEVARPTAGTGLWRRIVITRNDLSKIDLVTEQAVKYNFY